MLTITRHFLPLLRANNTSDNMLCTKTTLSVVIVTFLQHVFADEPCPQGTYKPPGGYVGPCINQTDCGAMYNRLLLRSGNGEADNQCGNCLPMHINADGLELDSRMSVCIPCGEFPPPIPLDQQENCNRMVTMDKYEMMQHELRQSLSESQNDFTALSITLGVIFLIVIVALIVVVIWKVKRGKRPTQETDTNHESNGRVFTAEDSPHLRVNV